MSIQKRQLINNETGAAFVPIGHTEATYDANGNTVEQRLAVETQERQAADIDLQRDVAELQDTTARVGDGYEPDLSVTDASGNSIVQFQNGHIKTKNFDSEETQEALGQVQSRMTELDDVEDDVAGLKETSPKINNGESMIDFAITDASGNAIVEFGDGHVRTKNFNSANTLKTEERMEDLTFEDESGNVLAEFSRGHIKTKYFDSSKMKAAKELKILTIGSSFAYDAFSYVPPLLENIAGVSVTWGILYYPGCTMEQHLQFLTNDNGYQYYSRYSSVTGQWVQSYLAPIPSTCIESEDWDLIILMNNSDSYRDSDPYNNLIKPYLQGVIDIVMEHAHNARLAWNLIPSGTVNLDMDATYAKIATSAQNVVRDTIIDVVIPCGTAIANARHTSLDDLGDGGHMTYEGLHLQEGVPCLIDAYAAVLKILEISGYGEKGIIGNAIRPTLDWLTAINVLNPQPAERTPVGVGDSVWEYNRLLSQKCAIWAAKKPYEITENIEPSNT